MDWKNLRRLARFMAKLDLAEVEIEEEGKRFRLRRPEGRAAETPGAHAPPADPGAAPYAPPAPAPVEEGIVEFRSPLVGTFYRAASPEAEPFVQKGSRIEADTLLCIIEAMKVMNEVRAEAAHAGEVADVLAENGEPIEFGQPLFRIRTR